MSLYIAVTLAMRPYQWASPIDRQSDNEVKLLGNVQAGLAKACKLSMIIYRNLEWLG